MLRLERSGAMPFGYEILGVDINTCIDVAARAEIGRAFDSEGVVFLRGQALNPVRQVDNQITFREI